MAGIHNILAASGGNRSFIYKYPGSQSNLIINPAYANAGTSAYVAGRTTLIVTAYSSDIISSTSTNNAAITVTGFTSGDQIIIVNQGSIVGRGGDGAPGDVIFNSPIAGSPGGAAISLAFDVLIENTGYICGGGGGGGNGGYRCGAGGGGGAGGGKGGDSAQGFGGSGGSVGNAGVPATTQTYLGGQSNTYAGSGGGGSYSVGGSPTTPRNGSAPGSSKTVYIGGRSTLYGGGNGGVCQTGGDPSTDLWQSLIGGINNQAATVGGTYNGSYFRCGSGGGGGGFGVAGGAGYGSYADLGVKGAGGAAGKAIELNGYTVTWSPQGTVWGLVS